MSFFPKESVYYSSNFNLHLSSIIESWNSNESGDSFSFITKPMKNTFSGFKKSGPIYSMHRYWTKQPIEIISYFIDHFCPSSGIVLDSFCGTGTTGTSALNSGRKIILSDLSPIATFIAKNYTEKTDISEITASLKKLHSNIQPLLNKYYSTNCPQCHSKGQIKDWIYSENFLCPNCLIELPFIEDSTDWNYIISKKHSKNVHCNSCKSNFNKNNLESIQPKVLGLRYSCSVCKERKKFKNLDLDDFSILSDPVLEEFQLKFMKIPLPVGVNTNQAIHKNIKFVNQFFTPITFFMLYSIWENINSFSEAIKSKLQFIFSSIIYRVTKLYRLRVKGQGGILSGTLYIPPLFQDINVWDVFLERYRKISKGWKKLNEILPENFNQKRIISTNSATKLYITTNSIDYVYIDPPYGGNINYSELNFLWESWFNQLTIKNEEVVINEIGQNKDLHEYEHLFTMALSEIYRVLKPNRWCSLVFNSSSSKIWSSIQKIINKSDFLMSNEIVSLGSNMITAKQTQSLKTARRYFVLNLFKASNNLNTDPIKFIAKNSFLEQGIKNFIISEVQNFISNSFEQKARYDEIYDHIIVKLLSKYSFDEFNLEKILEDNFKVIANNYWTFN